MLVFKSFTLFIVFCVVQVSLGKPASENESNALTEGRGIMSSIWEWITSPFTWWSSPEIEQPVTEQLVASTTVGVTENIEIREHNVTIWCNDQTCTTMKCDKTECRNVTCNLYDTDLHGQCREYNIIETPDEYTDPKSTDVTTKAPEKTEPTEKIVHESAGSTTSAQTDNITPEVPLIQLEAVLSSTINEKNVEKPQKTSE